MDYSGDGTEARANCRSEGETDGLSVNLHIFSLE